MQKGEPCLLGIDEAGRGPVLGPMVYGACWCPVRLKDHLAKMGFADSKTLNDSQREALFDKIKASDILGWAVDILSPQEISGKMLRRSRHSLNEISHDSAIGLVRNACDKGVNVTEIYVDTVGDPERYQEKLSRIFPGIKCTVTAKADSLFPCVSAASICAKQTRDHCLKDWEFHEETHGHPKISRQWGCGYPSDELTKNWMETNLDPVFGYPSLVRFSWAPAKKLIKEQGVEMEWEDEDEEEEEGADGVVKKSDTQKLSQFFVKADSEFEMKSRIPLAARFSYFRTRNINVVTDFS